MSNLKVGAFCLEDIQNCLWIACISSAQTKGEEYFSRCEAKENVTVFYSSMNDGMPWWVASGYNFTAEN